MQHNGGFAWQPVWLAIGLVLAMHLPGVFGYPLAGTEPHRVIPAHEMLGGNGVSPLVPTLFGEVYLRKPPGHHWLIVASEAIFGANHFAWRLPSVLAAALTAAVLAGGAGAGVGRGAGFVAALGFVLLVPLWSQSRTADIDATNTLCATAAAVALLALARREVWTLTRSCDLTGRSVDVPESSTTEPAAMSPLRPVRSQLQPESQGHAGGWAMIRMRRLVLPVLAALAILAGLMVKGPAVLPVVVGAVLGPLLIVRRWGWLLTITPLLMLAVAGFLLWHSAARRAVADAGLAFDASGQAEAMANLLPGSVGEALGAVALPGMLWVYALPVSIALPLLLWPRARLALGPWWPMVKLVLATLGVAAVVCVLSGMTKPRYAYPLLPLVVLVAAPLAVRLAAGLRAGDAWQGEAAWRWLGLSAIGCGGLAVGTTVVLGVLTGQWFWLIIPAVGIAFGGLALYRDIRARQVGPTLADGAALLLLAVVVFNALHIQQRTARSAVTLREELAEAVGRQPIAAARQLFSRPEMFWQRGLDIDYLGTRPMKPTDVPAGRWAVLHVREWPAFEAAGWREVERLEGHETVAIVAAPPVGEE